MSAKLSHAEIEILLNKISNLPWIHVYDGSSTWSVGQVKDPQIFQVCSTEDATNAEFIAASPQIVAQLLGEVKEYSQKQIDWSNEELRLLRRIEGLIIDNQNKDTQIQILTEALEKVLSNLQTNKDDGVCEHPMSERLIREALMKIKKGKYE